MKICWFDTNWRSKKYNVKVLDNFQQFHGEELYRIVIIERNVDCQK